MSTFIQQHAKNNIILDIVSGSHLYGTNTESSDVDYIGIFTPPVEIILGMLPRVNNIEIGHKVKDIHGKNTNEAVDHKLYEFRNFLNLALANNPNILEILFVNESSIQYINNTGQSLLDLRRCFPSKLCVTKFVSYAHSQKHKMVIRRDHYENLVEAQNLLSSCDSNLVMAEVFDRYIKYRTSGLANIFFKKENSKYIYCGDICIEPGVYAKKALKIVNERLAKAGNRKELLTKYGFDTKFGSHLIRLLYEGLMLLEQQTLIFPLPFASIITDIKTGKWEMDKVLELADKLEAKIRQMESKSNLRSKPDFDTIHKFCMNTLREVVCNQKSIPA
jgi:predicted nucleotidyltransferase